MLCMKGTKYNKPIVCTKNTIFSSISVCFCNIIYIADFGVNLNSVDFLVLFFYFFEKVEAATKEDIARVGHSFGHRRLEGPYPFFYRLENKTTCIYAHHNKISSAR